MISLLFASAAAVFFPGIITRTKSVLSGRKGPSVLQPWSNIRLLLRKGNVISETTSWIFRSAPVMYLATIIVAILFLPFPGFPPLIGFPGDFIFFAYILALGKIFFILGALDTGSSFEGMGANRETLYSMLTEPAFFILMGTLALFTGHYSMEEIFILFRFPGYNAMIVGCIAVYLLVQIAMVENSRMPVDDPKTHLELTMIHEVMILDHSGIDLALIQIGTILKFSVYGILISNILIPAEISIWIRIMLFVLIMAAFAITAGIMESFRARKKISKNPQFILALSAIALVAFVFSLLLMNRMIL